MCVKSEYLPCLCIFTFSCLTDGINGWITYVALFTAPLLIIFVMNTTLYLLTWWKIRSEIRIIRKNFGQDMRKNDKVSSIKAAKNMSLFVAAFFVQLFTAALFGAWSLLGEVPVAIFHVNTTLTNLGGLLNLRVFFIINKKRCTRTSTQKFSRTLNSSQSQGTVSSFISSRIGDSMQTVSTVTNWFAIVLFMDRLTPKIADLISSVCIESPYTLVKNLSLTKIWR